MAVRPRHHSLLTDAKWQAALGRQSTVEKVLDFVVTHWARLQNNPPDDMLFAKPEPKITKYFGLSLCKFAKTYGITGIFIVEHNVADIDEVKQELEKRGRTDITYFSNGIDPALEFVLECKKLKPSSLGKASRREYAKNGVLRFVNGIYARGTDLGFMVGFVEHDSDVKSISTALSRMIQEPDMTSLLRMITNDHGNVITSPSRSFKACAFETYHARDHAKDSPDMVLGHLILSHRP